MRRDNRHAHSTTKYLNGHFDVVGGIAIVADDHELSDRLKFFTKRRRRGGSLVRLPIGIGMAMT